MIDDITQHFSNNVTTNQMFNTPQSPLTVQSFTPSETCNFLLLQWIMKWLTFDQMQNNSLQPNLLPPAKWQYPGIDSATMKHE